MVVLGFFGGYDYARGVRKITERKFQALISNIFFISLASWVSALNWAMQLWVGCRVGHYVGFADG
jgi:hypothetical protein